MGIEVKAPVHDWSGLRTNRVTSGVIARSKRVVSLGGGEEVLGRFNVYPRDSGMRLDGQQPQVIEEGTRQAWPPKLIS